MENERNYIIGIAGCKNSGKDTVADMINYIFHVGITKANYSNYLTTKNKIQNKLHDRTIHFADNLKKCISILYNIDINVLNDRKYKDELYYCINTNKFINEENIGGRYNKINIDDLKYETLKEILEFNDKNNIISIIKIRTLLQYFGTDLCRNNLSNNIWIKSTIGNAVNIAETKKVCIIPDVRFENEANAIKNNAMSLYGRVIKINRDVEQQTHDSENIDFECDYTINNNGTLMQLFYKVLNIIVELLNK